MGTKDEKLAAAFGALLRTLRTAAGLSQGELGQRINPPMQAQAVARYEGGSRVPTLALLYRLAAALGCKPCDLLPGGAELPAPKPKKRKPPKEGE